MSDTTTTETDKPSETDKASTTDKAAESSGTATEGKGTSTRTRTRSRSRATADAASRGGKGAKGDEPESGAGRTRSEKAEKSGDEPASKDARSSDDDTSEGGRKRRRRRGRRGRGKGKGGDARAKESGKDSGKDSGDGGKGSGDSSGGRAEKAAPTRLAAKNQRRNSGRGQGGGRGRRPGFSDEVRRSMLESPPKTMLVTTLGARTQIAVLEDRTLVEHFVTRKDQRSLVGNIYMARVQNVLPGMEAAFLDIGKGRNGVLYAGEVLYDENDLEGDKAPRIEDTLKQGQKVLVQVTKDPMGHKGARLTQIISLAGRYMVLTPNSDVFGISRKLADDDRERLRKVLKKVKPAEHGVIVRTAAAHADDEQLEADIKRLLARWEKVQQDAENAKALEPVYEEPPLVVKVIRDNFGPEFVKCVIDDPELYRQVLDYLEDVAPELVEKLEYYDLHVGEGEDKKDPLFDAYNANDQIKKALDRKVWLPSGGYLIIEKTEAMTIVDVNTGKFTGDAKSNLEETVLKTNLEAAEEIVRQLRLRDIGGIIVIDFIDMLLKANQDQVIRKLKRELLRDRTKTRVSEVSRLGLVQMTRKNVSAGLVEAFSDKCDNCNGHGYVVNFEG